MVHDVYTLVGIIIALILFIIASNCIKKMNPPFYQENDEGKIDVRKMAIWAIQIALCSLCLSAMALGFVIGEYIRTHA
jgi:hypothetical protein